MIYTPPKYDGRKSPLCAQTCVNDHPGDCYAGCFAGWNEQQAEAEDAAAGHIYEQCPNLATCEPHSKRWIAEDTSTQA